MEEPKIVTKPAFTIIGMKYRGKNEHEEIPQWGEFMPRAGEIKDKLKPDICYGFCDNYDDANGEFDYVAAFEIGGETEAPDGMVKWDVPAQTYAVFTCTLPTIREAYDLRISPGCRSPVTSAPLAQSSSCMTRISIPMSSARRCICTFLSINKSCIPGGD